MTIYKEWVDSARLDLEAARTLAADEKFAKISAFHLQQAMEKILKAMQIRQDKMPERTHDLIVLADGIKGATFQKYRKLFHRLNRYAVAVRYPSAIELDQETLETLMNQVDQFFHEYRI